MSRAEHWFRWHHGTVTDPKWRVIALRASHAMSHRVTQSHTESQTVSPAHVIAVWAAMLECASQASPRGVLDGWCDEDVAAGLGIGVEMVEAIRTAMQGKTLEGSDVSAWRKRQPKAEDTGAAKRKAESREQQKSRDVTPSHTESRDAATETETETETEEKQKLEVAEPTSPDSDPEKPQHLDAVCAVILAEYHRVLPHCQRIGVLTPKRQRKLLAADQLARKVCRQRGWDWDRRWFWGEYFAQCAADPWLRGDVPNPHNPRWKQSIEILVDDQRFAQVMDQALAEAGPHEAAA